MRGELILSASRNADIEQIAAWPGSTVFKLKELLSERQPPPDELAESVRQGLRHQDASLTPLGENVHDILIHESWLVGDEFTAMIQRGVIKAHEAVLDVGCSTGWMLRQMPAAPQSRRVGIDIDQEALAIGHRLAASEGRAISFHACSAHALPFEDATFDWVVCRNALTYMHQKTALRQMMRVLKQGGRMFLRFENPLFDLQWLVGTRSPTMWLARARDFTYGCIAATVGWQPVPGGLIRGSRAFMSRRRLRRLLRAGGCRIAGTVDCLKCPRFLGRPNQTAVLVRKIERVEIARVLESAAVEAEAA